MAFKQPSLGPLYTPPPLPPVGISSPTPSFRSTPIQGSMAPSRPSGFIPRSVSTGYTGGGVGSAYGGDVETTANYTAAGFGRPGRDWPASISPQPALVNYLRGQINKSALSEFKDRPIPEEKELGLEHARLVNEKLRRQLDSTVSEIDTERNRINEKLGVMRDKLDRDLASGNWREAARARNATRELSNQQAGLDRTSKILDLMGLFARHPMLFQTSVNQLPQLVGALGTPERIGMETVGAEGQGALGPQLPGLPPGTAVSGAGTRPYGPDAQGRYEEGFPQNWASGTYVNNPRGPGSPAGTPPGYYTPGVTGPSPMPQLGGLPAQPGAAPTVNSFMGAGGQVDVASLQAWLGQLAPIAGFLPPSPQLMVGTRGRR